MRRLLDLVAIVIIVMLGLSFAMLNTAVVQLNYYFGAASMPLSLWLTIVLFVGALLGALSTTGILLRQRAEIVRLRRRTKLVERNRLVEDQRLVEHQASIGQRKLPVGNTT